MLKSTRLLYKTLLRRVSNGSATGDELNTLALMTDAGYVLRPNPRRALVFLRAAAECCGHPCATATLAAVMQSLRWWRVAATWHNNAWAQTVVGDSFATSGTFTAAVRWWWKAWRNGDSAAGTRLICLSSLVNRHNTTIDPCVQACTPQFMEVEIPQLAVLWSVYFETLSAERSETTEAATDTQLDVYVSRVIDATAVEAHVLPLLQNLELASSTETVSTVSWVAAPTRETAAVTREFTAAFSAVHTVSSDVGSLVHLEGELRPTPDNSAAELWFCATFDTDVVAPEATDAVPNDFSMAGASEWLRSAPHAAPNI